MNYYKTQALTDIARIDRAKKGVVYPAGTIYIQVSAFNKHLDEPFLFTKEPQEIETKHVVISPTILINQFYLVQALNAAVEPWRSRIVGDAINIAVTDFKYLHVTYDTRKEKQSAVADAIATIDKKIQRDMDLVDLLTSFKSYMMQKMFV